MRTLFMSPLFDFYIKILYNIYIKNEQTPMKGEKYNALG